jgi:hypothetical protein
VVAGRDDEDIDRLVVENTAIVLHSARGGPAGHLGDRGGGAVGPRHVRIANDRDIDVRLPLESTRQSRAAASRPHHADAQPLVGALHGGGARRVGKRQCCASRGRGRHETAAIHFARHVRNSLWRWRYR